MNAATETANPTIAPTVKINGRDYGVTILRERDGRPVFEIAGKRGARWFTMRNVKHPEYMFLAAYSMSTYMDGVWLTERDGALVQVTF